ncbi:SDR family NAD(P)-dependent oxidoreductase [Streptomyces sp. NPDC102462]|uniref:SDR family NAD(P)-dependent oxidoreductase n=1 Tax=Streptomyces sp. NPDC102462 TaxID=3366178 RepID=UPI0038123B80
MYAVIEFPTRRERALQSAHRDVQFPGKHRRRHLGVGEPLLREVLRRLGEGRGKVGVHIVEAMVCHRGGQLDQRVSRGLDTSRAQIGQHLLDHAGVCHQEAYFGSVGATGDFPAAEQKAEGSSGLTELSDGGDMHPWVGDVSDLAAVTALMDGVAERFGRLDVLVNNAGLALPGTVACGVTGRRLLTTRPRERWPI